MSWKGALALCIGALTALSGLVALVAPGAPPRSVADFTANLATAAESIRGGFPEKILFERDVQGRDKTLMLPDGLLPDPEQMAKFYPWLRAIADCSEAPSGADREPQARKLAVEWTLRCQKGSKVPEWVWQEWPRLHPMGGSWAMHLAAFDPNLAIKRLALHILEPGSYPPSDLNILSAKLTPGALRSLLAGRPLFWSGGDLFLYRGGSSHEKHYLQIPEKAFVDLSAHWPFQFVNQLNSDCVSVAETGCWVHARRFPYYLLRYVFLAGLLALLGLVSMQLAQERRLKRLAESQRELAAVAISHEIRHPVTSMLLSLESVRPHLESLPEDVQKEYGRMGQEIRRLKRLTEASETFLRLKEGGKPSWRPVKIESLRGFFDRLCGSYQVPCKFTIPDRAFITDAYWFGIAVENLIKNAKKHGQPPVSVEVGSARGRLVVQVVDAGPGIRAGDSRSEGGLGYGLYLTETIVRNLNGRFDWTHDPTSFKIEIEELPS